MALTFTKRISINMDISGKLFRAYEVTHDGSETTANARLWDEIHRPLHCCTRDSGINGRIGSLL